MSVRPESSVTRHQGARERERGQQIIITQQHKKCFFFKLEKTGERVEHHDDDGGAAGKRRRISRGSKKKKKKEKRGAVDSSSPAEHVTHSPVFQSLFSFDSTRLDNGTYCWNAQGVTNCSTSDRRTEREREKKVFNTRSECSLPELDHPFKEHFRECRGTNGGENEATHQQEKPSRAVTSSISRPAATHCLCGSLDIVHYL